MGANLVIGHWILALAVSVVPSAVFIAKVEDGRRRGHGIRRPVVTKSRVALVALLLTLSRPVCQTSLSFQNLGEGTHIDFERRARAASPSISCRIIIAICIGLQRII